MAKKKNDETEEIVETAETPAGDDAATEKKPRKAASKKASDTEPAEEPSMIETALEAVESVVAAAVETISDSAEKLAEALAGTETRPIGKGKRAERVGVVASDKMTKTVVVRVDRLVKHPIYRKYVRKRKKFMAHDELGSKIGDKVRIVETRPLSARKRWRVVEIIQKAEL